MKVRLYGDILHPGIVEVEVEDLQELEVLLEKEMLTDEEEQFTVVDQQNDCLGFMWDGNPIEDEHGKQIQLPVRMESWDSKEVLQSEDECPNCKNGTLGLEDSKLACRGECGQFFNFTVERVHKALACCTLLPSPGDEEVKKFAEDWLLMYHKLKER